MSTPVAPPDAPVVDPPHRRGTHALVGLGVALLAAAAVVSAFYARQDGDLDWSVYVIGLGVTAALLLVVLVGAVGRDPGATRALTGLPGAIGAVAAGAMVGVGFDDGDWVEWAVGGVILGVAVVAYLLGRAGAPTIAAVVGLLVLYAKAVDELLDLGSDAGLVEYGAVIVVFVVAVTALGWLLPHRALIGVTVGAGGAFALVYTYGFTYLFYGFGGFSAPVGAEGGSPFEDRDIYATLAYAGGLILLWTLAAWATGNTGFRVISVALAAAVVPLSMAWLAVEHPTWWGAALAVAGGLVLLLALVAGRRAHRQAPDPRDDEPVEPFFGPRPPATPAEGTPVGTGPTGPDRPAPGAPSPNPPPGGSDATVIAPSDAPPPPAPGDRRPG